MLRLPPINQAQIQMRPLPQAERQRGSQRTETAPVEMAVDSRFHRECLMRSVRGWLLQRVAADFNKRISPAKAPLNPARPRRRKIITAQGRSSQRLSQPVVPQLPAIRFYCKERSVKDRRSMGPLGSQA
jgi:hypothetical protein